MLESGGYKYIEGARIKNEEENIKQWILTLAKKDGEFDEINKGDARLIVAIRKVEQRKTDTTEKRV